jgi:hypothetical protein
MALLVATNKNKFHLFPALPAPVPAVCSRLVLHKDVKTKFGKQDRVQLVFQIPSVQWSSYVPEDQLEQDGPGEVSIFCRAIISEDSALGKILSKQIKVKTLLKDPNVDIESILLGSQWLLTTVHNEVGDKIYCNIDNLMRGPKDQNVQVVEQDDIPFDEEDDE